MELFGGGTVVLRATSRGLIAAASLATTLAICALALVASAEVPKTPLPKSKDDPLASSKPGPVSKSAPKSKLTKKARRGSKTLTNQDVRVELTLITARHRDRVVLDTAASAARLRRRELRLDDGKLILGDDGIVGGDLKLPRVGALRAGMTLKFSNVSWVKIRSVRRRPRARGLRRPLVRQSPKKLVPLHRLFRRPSIVVRRPCRQPKNTDVLLDELVKLQKRGQLTHDLYVLGPCPGPYRAQRGADVTVMALGLAGIPLRAAMLVEGTKEQGRAQLPRKTLSKRHRTAIAALLKVVRRRPSPAAIRRRRVRAALRRRSSATLRAQRVERQVQRAGQLAKGGATVAALRSVAGVLEVAPEHDQARRLRALLLARQGDLSGALREVAWWRKRYGDVAADGLLDELRQARRAPPPGPRAR
jgi:hypothetical protein